MFAEMILGDPRAEPARQGVFLVRGSKGAGPRCRGTRWLQSGESREFVGGRSHLGTQAVENRERRFFRARGKIACGAYAGWTALFAGAGRYEFARFLH